MSSKQKIAISAIGIVLVLAIIGLTIGLVLVASTAIGNSSMTVTYKATNVQCSIAATGVHYANSEATSGDSITIETGTSPLTIDARATDGAMGTLAFASQALTANSEAVYTFTITNKATADASAKAIKVSAALTGTPDNITVLIGGTRAGATEATSYNIASINAQDHADVVVVLKVTDATVNADLVSNLTLTITQVA